MSKKLYDAMPDYNFKDFDPTIMEQYTRKTIKTDSAGISVIIFGSRGRGKSVCMRYLVYSLRKSWDEVYLFSETSQLQPKTYEYIPKDHQFSEFAVDKLSELIERQKEDVNHKIENKQEDKIQHLLFLFDDVISNPKIRSTPAFNSLFTLGRHIRISVIILTQCYGGRDGVGKAARNNIDLTISFFPQNVVDREAIVDQYLSTENSKYGEEILRQITSEDYCAIAIVGRKPAMNYEDYVFKLKAPLKVPAFIIGKKPSNVIVKNFNIRDRGLNFNQNKFILNTEEEEEND